MSARTRLSKQNKVSMGGNLSSRNKLNLEDERTQDVEKLIELSLQKDWERSKV
jgi:hypothetical protein